MRKINEIIVHCTATFPEQQVTVADITRWHREKGWATCGYHYVICLDGTIQNGRPIEEVGAHCKGHNTHSIGVCYVGGLAADGKPADTRNNEQRASMVQLLKQLLQQYPQATIHGHNEFAAKACPCFSVQQWLQEVEI